MEMYKGKIVGDVVYYPTSNMYYIKMMPLENISENSIELLKYIGIKFDEYSNMYIDNKFTFIQSPNEKYVTLFSPKMEKIVDIHNNGFVELVFNPIIKDTRYSIFNGNVIKKILVRSDFLGEEFNPLKVYEIEVSNELYESNKLDDLLYKVNNNYRDMLLYKLSNRDVHHIYKNIYNEIEELNNSF